MTMNSISTETKYIRTDGWRGYSQPVDAVCGANDTGSEPDSPCPSSICRAELAMARKILRGAAIPYRTQVCGSSNIFCIHRYIVVHAGNVEKAKALIQPIINQCRLLYIA